LGRPCSQPGRNPGFFGIGGSFGFRKLRAANNFRVPSVEPLSTTGFPGPRPHRRPATERKTGRAPASGAECLAGDGLMTRRPCRFQPFLSVRRGFGVAGVACKKHAVIQRDVNALPAVGRKPRRKKIACGTKRAKERAARTQVQSGFFFGRQVLRFPPARALFFGRLGVAGILRSGGSIGLLR